MKEAADAKKCHSTWTKGKNQTDQVFKEKKIESRPFAGTFFQKKKD